MFQRVSYWFTVISNAMSNVVFLWAPQGLPDSPRHRSDRLTAVREAVLVAVKRYKRTTIFEFKNKIE